MLQQSVAVQSRHRSAPVVDFSPARQEWVEIGLATQPADRKAAEAAIANTYRAAGLEAPRKIVWCGSPFAMGLARAIMLDPAFLACVAEAVWNNVKESETSTLKNEIVDSFRTSMRLTDTAAVKQNLAVVVKANVAESMTRRLTEAMKEHIRSSVTETVWQGVWNSVWDGCWDAVWRGIDTGLRKAIEARDKSLMDQGITESLKGCIGDLVKATVWNKTMDDAWTNIRTVAYSHVRVAAWNSLWGVLQKSVWENVALPIGECLKASGNDSAYASCYGQHDAYWLSFYAYFRERENLTVETEQVAGLLDIARCAGWFVPHAHMCWISERPVALSLNPDGKLHAIEEPALSYPDGWCIHAVDGALRFPSGSRAAG
ncbi:MAG: DUF6745 domain-containing protein [Noviherbaspirillum sp.]